MRNMYLFWLLFCSASLIAGGSESKTEEIITIHEGYRGSQNNSQSGEQKTKQCNCEKACCNAVKVLGESLFKKDVYVRFIAGSVVIAASEAIKNFGYTNYQFLGGAGFLLWAEAGVYFVKGVVEESGLIEKLRDCCKGKKEKEEGLDDRFGLDEAFNEDELHENFLDEE